MLFKIKHIFESISKKMEENGSESGSQISYNNIFMVRLIEKSMAVFLFLFPCLVSTWSMFKKFNMYKNEYGIPHNLVFWVFFCMVAAILLEAVMLYRGKQINTVDIMQLCLVAFMLRGFFAFLFNGQPVGDFLVQFNYAINPDEPRERMIPYFAAYSYLIGILMKLFNTKSVVIGMMLNVFFTGLIPAVIFYAARKFANDGVAYLAAVCYAFFPSMILYSVCFSGENISQFFLALLFLMLVCLWDAEKEKNIKGIFAYAVLSCICAAFLNIFKPIFSLVVLCILMEEIIYRIIPSLVGAVQERNVAPAIRSLVAVAGIFFLMVGFNKLIFGASALVMENWYNTEKISVSGYGPKNFVEIAYNGLKEEGEGRVSEEVINQIRQIKEQNENYDDAEDEMISIILAQIKASPSNFKNFLLRKMRISWADEYDFAYLSGIPKEGNTHLMDSPSGHFSIYVVSMIYMSILYIGCMLGFIFKIMQKKAEVCRSEGMMYIFFGGFVMTFLIMPTAGRYKSTLMPLICIISAIGVYNFGVWIDAIVLRVRKGL